MQLLNLHAGRSICSSVDGLHGDEELTMIWGKFGNSALCLLSTKNVAHLRFQFSDHYLWQEVCVGGDHFIKSICGGLGKCYIYWQYSRECGVKNQSIGQLDGFFKICFWKVGTCLCACTNLKKPSFYSVSSNNTAGNYENRLIRSLLAILGAILRTL